jgi:hypothetical protein
MMCSIVIWSSVTTMRSTTSRRTFRFTSKDGSTSSAWMRPQKAATESARDRAC